MSLEQQGRKEGREGGGRREEEEKGRGAPHWKGGHSAFPHSVHRTRVPSAAAGGQRWSEPLLQGQRTTKQGTTRDQLVCRRPPNLLCGLPPSALDVAGGVYPLLAM